MEAMTLSKRAFRALFDPRNECDATSTIIPVGGGRNRISTTNQLLLFISSRHNDGDEQRVRLFGTSECPTKEKHRQHQHPHPHLLLLLPQMRPYCVQQYHHRCLLEELVLVVEHCGGRNLLYVHTDLPHRSRDRPIHVLCCHCVCSTKP